MICSDQQATTTFPCPGPLSVPLLAPHPVTLVLFLSPSPGLGLSQDIEQLPGHFDLLPGALHGQRHEGPQNPLDCVKTET